MLLTSEQIKAAKGKDIKTEKVPMPEWAPEGTNPEDCHILVRTFSGAYLERWDVARYAAYTAKRDIVADGMALMATLACCGEDFKPLFTEMDIKWLGQMGAVPLRRIYEAALRINGLGAAAEDEAEKNSVPTEGSGSNSATDTEPSSETSRSESTPGTSPS